MCRWIARLRPAALVVPAGLLVDASAISLEPSGASR